jgi:hypothetical protein
MIMYPTRPKLALKIFLEIRRRRRVIVSYTRKIIMIQAAECT